MPTHFLLAGDVRDPAELEHADFLLDRPPEGGRGARPAARDAGLAAVRRAERPARRTRPAAGGRADAGGPRPADRRPRSNCTSWKSKRVAAGVPAEAGASRPSAWSTSRRGPRRVRARRRSRRIAPAGDGPGGRPEGRAGIKAAAAELVQVRDAGRAKIRGWALPPFLLGLHRLASCGGLAAGRSAGPAGQRRRYVFGTAGGCARIGGDSCSAAIVMTRGTDETEIGLREDGRRPPVLRKAAASAVLRSRAAMAQVRPKAADRAGGPPRAVDAAGRMPGAPPASWAREQVWAQGAGDSARQTLQARTRRRPRSQPRTAVRREADQAKRRTRRPADAAVNREIPGAPAARRRPTAGRPAAVRRPRVRPPARPVARRRPRATTPKPSTGTRSWCCRRTAARASSSSSPTTSPATRCSSPGTRPTAGSGRSRRRSRPASRSAVDPKLPHRGQQQRRGGRAGAGRQRQRRPPGRELHPVADEPLDRERRPEDGRRAVQGRDRPRPERQGPARSSAFDADTAVRAKPGSPSWATATRPPSRTPTVRDDAGRARRASRSSARTATCWRSGPPAPSVAEGPRAGYAQGPARSLSDVDGRPREGARGTAPRAERLLRAVVHGELPERADPRLPEPDEPGEPGGEPSGARELLDRGYARLTSFECPDTPAEDEAGVRVVRRRRPAARGADRVRAAAVQGHGPRRTRWTPN